MNQFDEYFQSESFALFNDLAALYYSHESVRHIQSVVKIIKSNSMELDADQISEIKAIKAAVQDFKKDPELKVLYAKLALRRAHAFPSCRKYIVEKEKLILLINGIA